MPRAPSDPARAVLRKQAGAWLKATREAAGLTQAELAERVGLRYYTFVSQVESGHGRVPIETQGAWAKAVGVDETEFARLLLGLYDPELYRLLFGEEPAGGDGRDARPARAAGH